MCQASAGRNRYHLAPHYEEGLTVYDVRLYPECPCVVVNAEIAAL